jgi:hypothetical protein
MQNKVVGEVVVMKKIPQKVLEEYLAMKDEIDKMHKSLFASLELGAEVEDGKYKAFIDKGSDKKTDKAARAKVIELGGEAAWEDVLNKAERKPYERLRVVNEDVEAAKKKAASDKAKAKRAAAKAAKAAAKVQK